MSAPNEKIAINLYNRGEYLEAYNLWKQDAKQNNPQAITNIGLLYLKGEGVAMDIAKAKKYFEKGISLNSSSSFFNLATMYQNAIGVKLDNDKAIEYFKKAANLNHEGACFRLALTFLKDKTNKELLKEGFSYMVKAAQNNSLMAKIQLKGFSKDKKIVSKKNKDFYEKTKEKQIAVINDALDRYIRPVLKNDGGNILLVDVVMTDAYEIRLVYAGNCEGCSLASTSTYDLINNTFSEIIDSSIKVYII